MQPRRRQALAGAARAAARPVTPWAEGYPVGRQFVCQQTGKAGQALAAAFAPDLPAEGRVLFRPPATAVRLHRLIRASLLACHSS